jgi:hypothetical protein
MCSQSASALPLGKVVSSTIGDPSASFTFVAPMWKAPASRGSGLYFIQMYS